MKLLILTGRFGMGHWSASVSLKEQLERDDPRNTAQVTDFFEYALPDLSPALYKGFNLLVSYGGGIYNLVHRLTANAEAPRFDPVADGLAEKLGQLLEEAAPDLVIATHPVCAQLMSRYKLSSGCPIPLVTCITDVTCHSEWINQCTDCYLAGSPSVRAGLMEKGVAPELIEVTGIPVRQQFKKPVRRGGGLPRSLLIMGGGLGLLPRRRSFYDALNALPNVRTTIITGHNDKLRRRLEGRWENITVLGFTDRVADYMASADLMLSKPGGITMFEAIFSQLPLLAWGPSLAQEQENAAFLTAAGVGRVTDKEPEACLAAIRSTIYNDELLSDMADNMGRLTAQLKAEYVGDILAALTKGRKVSA